VPEYGNTREIGFMCLLRLYLAVAIRQAECRADRLWRQKSGGFMSPNEPDGFEPKSSMRMIDAGKRFCAQDRE
jgi:hypothetical protein